MKKKEQQPAENKVPNEQPRPSGFEKQSSDDLGKNFGENADPYGEDYGEDTGREQGQNEKTEPEKG